MKKISMLFGFIAVVLFPGHDFCGCGLSQGADHLHHSF